MHMNHQNMWCVVWVDTSIPLCTRLATYSRLTKDSNVLFYVSCTTSEMYAMSLMLEIVYIQPTQKPLALHSHTDLIFVIAIPEFVTTPTSVNATLGSTATFNCNATAGLVAWIVNGSLLSHQITPDITTSGGGTTSSLHVPAIEKYNNMNVTCIVFTIRHDLSDDLLSGPVVLRIQGMHSEQIFHAGIISRNLRKIFQSPFVQSRKELAHSVPTKAFVYPRTTGIGCCAVTQRVIPTQFPLSNPFCL